MKQPNSTEDLTRRAVLKAGATTAAAVGLPLNALGAEDSAEKKPLPTRVLGRTGKKVSILNLGTAQGDMGARMFNAAYANGVRYFDTADCYIGGDSEQKVGDWLAGNGRRKEFFVVTKDHPETPEQWVQMVDARLAALKTDYIDMFFIHGLGGGFRGGGDETARDIPKDKDWAKAADTMKKAGKIHAAGFSTHTMISLRTALLNNAATGGWVDAIMVGYDPKLVRENADFNKALDACHKAGVGLISMKEMRGLDAMPKILPEFESMGLTSHQAVLHAVWNDERFASICSAMTNFKMLEENSDAARKFKPMPDKKISAVIDLYKRYAGTFCNGCDGRCQQAGGTRAALGDMARYLSYFERDGSRAEARALYAALPKEQRDWHGADLAAASAACTSQLDFEALLARVEQKLA